MPKVTSASDLPATIRATDLARILDFTDRWLRDLAKAGWFPAPVRGVYPFEAFLAGLAKYWKAQKEERGNVATLEARKLAKQIEVLDEDLTARKRKNRSEEKELVEVATVNAAQLATDNIVRQKILELGNRFESRYVVGMTAPKFRKMVDESTDEILTELSKQLELFAQGGDKEEE